MQGDLVPVVDWVRDSFLVYPARAFVAFPLVYHYGGGMRHLLWDSAKYKMQGEKGDVLDLEVSPPPLPTHPRTTTKRPTAGRIWYSRG